ncbi:MAG: YciI family protein [Vicinamibacterales bacterium]
MHGCGTGLRERGVLVAAEALQPVETATTLRVRDGRARITDGPFAEQRQLAGFYLIDATDLDEALELAAKIPPAREGSIEIRPIRQLDGGGNRGRRAEVGGQGRRLLIAKC